MMLGFKPEYTVQKMSDGTYCPCRYSRYMGYYQPISIFTPFYQTARDAYEALDKHTMKTKFIFVKRPKKEKLMTKLIKRVIEDILLIIIYHYLKPKVLKFLETLGNNRKG